MRTGRDADRARAVAGGRSRVPGLAVTALAAVMLSLTAAPAHASSCRTDEVSTTAVLAPGESATTRRTVELPDGEVVMAAAKPTFTGDLGPHLSVSLSWCAGTGCTPASLLEPDTKAQLTATSVTIEQSVTLAATAPATAASGTVRSRVSLGSENCGQIVDDLQDGVGGGGAGSEVLALSGGNLTAGAWGLAMSAVGLFFWVAGRGHRRVKP